jgi:hypothetical protein
MSGAPSPQALIRHFLSTVDDYERLEATFPLPNGVNVLSHGDDEQSRFAALLHAAVLRKYDAPHDKLHLAKVVKALRQCVVERDYSAQTWDELTEALRVPPADIGRFYVGESGYSEGVILENELYGRYLHGDYDKWQHTQRVRPVMSDSPVLIAVGSRATRVVRLAQLIRAGIREGAVVIEDPSAMIRA